MAWTYRKKLVCVHTSQEKFDQQQWHSVDSVFEDWFHDQVAQGLADSDRAWLPYRDTGEFGTTTEVLVTDQTQADSFIIMNRVAAEKIGYSLSVSVEDVVIERESYEDY